MIKLSLKKYQFSIYTAGLIGLSLLLALPALTAEGNRINDSFSHAKKLLENHVYYDHRVTIYCGAEFNAEKMIALPVGFDTSKYASRAQRVEWEHIVPAENFGRTFPEWRDGHPDCRNYNGSSFRGRKCAEKSNQEYRYMQSDMYNLYPAIGSVNAARSNYNFTQFQEDTKSSFGTCLMKIQDKKAEPPARARGPIARTYLYFETTYPRYKMSDSQRKLMQAWNKIYPVTEWECVRACRIEHLQKNENTIVKEQCVEKGLWPKGEDC